MCVIPSHKAMAITMLDAPLREELGVGKHSLAVVALGKQNHKRLWFIDKSLLVLVLIWLLKDSYLWCPKTSRQIWCCLYDRNNLIHQLLVANFANTKWCKKTGKWLKPWHMGTYMRVLSENFPMNTNMTGFRSFSKIVASLCFGWK